MTRPDYQKLCRLRTLFPVPILALSATCPPVVLRDLLKTLHMPALVSGTGNLLYNVSWYIRTDASSDDSSSPY